MPGVRCAMATFEGFADGEGRFLKALAKKNEREWFLAHKDEFAQTFTEKMMMYALGREVEYYDMPTIRKIIRTTKPANFRFSSIVMAIVNTPAFQTSTVELTKQEPAAPAKVASR